MTLTIINTVSVIVILAAMILLLLGIGHLTSSDNHADYDDMKQFRRDLDDRDDVITDQSAFAELVKVKVKSHRTDRFDPRK